MANVKDIHSCWPEKNPSPLTLKGKKEVRVVVQKLKSKKVDFIFSSDLLRTKQTAEITGKELKIRPKYDKRLREVNVGIFNARPVKEYKKELPNLEKRFNVKAKGGETYSEVKKRMFDFLKDIDKRYKGKNILVISHQAPLVLLEAKVKGIPNSQVFKIFLKEKRIKTGELRKLKP